jgi:hypothetical protein
MAPITLAQNFSGTYGHNGNDKVGKGVSIVNREAGTTCPGASELCEAICYAKRGNFHRFGLQKKFAAGILNLPNTLRDLFRWHVSGDFDTVEYIQFAIDVVRAHPNTRFWAYTRSWNVAGLLPHLETLRALPNMQLFASCDDTMPLPPEDWRVAYIRGDARFRGMTCLEQECSKACPTDCEGRGELHTPKMPDCKACGYCPIKTRGNVEFKIH